MKKLSALLFALVACFTLAGCSTAPDSRTSLTGEFCVGGFCITPQVAPQAPAPLYNAIPGGSTRPVVTAPVVSAAAVAPVMTSTYQATYAVPEPLPPPISYNSPVAAAPVIRQAPAYAPAPPVMNAPMPVRPIEK